MLKDKVEIEIIDVKLSEKSIKTAEKETFSLINNLSLITQNSK